LNLWATISSCTNTRHVEKSTDTLEEYASLYAVLGIDSAAPLAIFLLNDVQSTAQQYSKAQKPKLEEYRPRVLHIVQRVQ